MHIGLFFGSFNPIHNGHLIIAQHIVNYSYVDQVWLMVSPQNPLKPRHTLLDEKHRYYMANLAVEDNEQIRASQIEFHLPRPSYTIDTLTYLKEKYPQHDFSLIMGGDNLVSIEKWKNYRLLLESYPLLVYKRPGFNTDMHFPFARIQCLDAPLLHISSTFIRQSIQLGKDVRYLVPDVIYRYLKEMHFYED